MAGEVTGALAGLVGKKVGPVPVWLIVVGGGVVLAFVVPRFLPNLFGGGSSTTTGGLGNTAGSPATPADPNLDPNTGVPYAVEEAIDPNTGLPAYFQLFGRGGGGLGGLPGPGGPGGPVQPGGGSPGGPGGPTGPNQPVPGSPPAPPTSPGGPTGPNQPVDPGNAAKAIKDWEARNHQKWTGPPGSFPAGWGPTPHAPGAGQFVKGVFHWVVPPAVPGPGRMPPQPVNPTDPIGGSGHTGPGSPGYPSAPTGPTGPASPYPGGYPRGYGGPTGPAQPWPPVRRI